MYSMGLQFSNPRMYEYAVPPGAYADVELGAGSEPRTELTGNAYLRVALVGRAAHFAAALVGARFVRARAVLRVAVVRVDARALVDVCRRSSRSVRKIRSFQVRRSMCFDP